MLPTEVKQGVGAVVLAAVVLLAGSGCGESYDPATLDDKPSAVGPIRSPAETSGASDETPAESAEPTATPEPTPTVDLPPIDVCGLLTPKEVENLFRRGKVPRMSDPAGDPQAFPGTSAVFSCSYRWQAGENTPEILSISAVRHTGTADAQGFVDLITPESEPVGSVGDVAGFRQEPATVGTATLVAGQETADGIAGVVVTGPAKPGVQAFAEVARKVLAEL